MNKGNVYNFIYSNTYQLYNNLFTNLLVNEEV